jgi:hypothetical protein
MQFGVFRGRKPTSPTKASEASDKARDQSATSVTRLVSG